MPSEFLNSKLGSYFLNWSTSGAGAAATVAAAAGGVGVGVGGVCDFFSVPWTEQWCYKGLEVFKILSLSLLQKSGSWISVS